MSDRGVWSLLIVLMGIFLASPGQAADISLRSIYARNYELKDLVETSARGRRGVVFAFFKVGCPAVDLAIPELKALYSNYKDRGIAFYAIYSNGGTGLREVQVHAQQFDVPFRVFLDVGQELAKTWQVQRTAEVVFVNMKQGILYRGAVTDADRTGRRDGRYLADALQSFLAGDAIKVASTRGQGCLINTKRPAPIRNLTWYKDILPIFQAKCQKCHRPGEIGPMSLLSYKNAVNNAPMIAEVVEDRIMPPWPVESPLKLENDHRLTDEEIRKIVSWIETDTAEGVPSDAPRPVVWPHRDQWLIG